MTNLNETLADVVAEDASRARTLDHVCARVGLDASAVVAQL